MKVKKMTEKDILKDFTDAFNACRDLLTINNQIINEKSETISMRSVIASQKMYEFMLEVMKKMMKYPGDRMSVDSLNETSRNLEKMEQKNQDNNPTFAINFDENKKSECLIDDKDKIIDQQTFNNKKEHENSEKFFKGFGKDDLCASKMTVKNHRMFLKTGALDVIESSQDEDASSTASSETVSVFSDEKIPHFSAENQSPEAGVTLKDNKSTNEINNNIENAKNRLRLVKERLIMSAKNIKLQESIDKNSQDTNEEMNESSSELNEKLKLLNNRPGSGNIAVFMKKLNNWVFIKYEEHIKKTKNNKVHDELIEKWGLEAKKLFWDIYFPRGTTKFRFSASETWINRFKRRYSSIKSGNFKNNKIEKRRKLFSIQQKNNFIDNMEKRKRKDETVLDKKEPVVAIACQRPILRIPELRKMSGYSKHSLQCGGSLHERKRKLKAWVFDKLLEYKRNNQVFTNLTIRDLGHQGKKIFTPDDHIFSASDAWLKRMKNMYHITGDKSDLQIQNSQ